MLQPVSAVVLGVAFAIAMPASLYRGAVTLAALAALGLAAVVFYLMNMRRVVVREDPRATRLRFLLERGRHRTPDETHELEQLLAELHDFRHDRTTYR